MSSQTPTIDFDKMDGLAPGIVQDAATGEVLMLGFLNPVSYAKTLETGFVTFWSLSLIHISLQVQSFRDA